MTGVQTCALPILNSKIRNYVDVLFADVPRTKKALELKEEILSNMSERFDDYIAEGKSENVAYSLTLSNMGDIDQMLKEVMPDADFVKEAAMYRKRNARNTAIGVSLYILGAMFLIGFATFTDASSNSLFAETFGLLVLLFFAAIATGLIVYTFMSTPPEYKDYDDKKKHEFVIHPSKSKKILDSILSIYWTLITFIYLAVSFVTMKWGITWIIWILAAVFGQIIQTVFELRFSEHE